MLHRGFGLPWSKGRGGPFGKVREKKVCSNSRVKEILKEGEKREVNGEAEMKSYWSVGRVFCLGSKLSLKTRFS